MTLDFVRPPEHAAVNVLLYGPPKTGKSVGAASAPGPVLYINSDQPNATRFAHLKFGDAIKELHLEGLKTLTDVATELKANPDAYKTVVLDTVGDAYRLLLEQASGRAVSPAVQNYQNAGTHLERFARGLCALPVNVVLVCHELAHKDDESASFERLPLTGTSNPALGAKLMAMVDVIGYTGIVQPEQEGADPLYMAQLVNGRGRRGGDRFGVLGQNREVDLTEWITTIEKKIAEDKKPNKQKEAA